MLEEADFDALPQSPPPLQEDPLDSLELVDADVEGELPAQDRHKQGQ